MLTCPLNSEQILGRELTSIPFERKGTQEIGTNDRGESIKQTVVKVGDTYWSAIYHHSWENGVTYINPTPFQVEPYEVKIIKWRTVKNDSVEVALKKANEALQKFRDGYRPCSITVQKGPGHCTVRTTHVPIGLAVPNVLNEPEWDSFVQKCKDNTELHNIERFFQ